MFYFNLIYLDIQIDFPFILNPVSCEIDRIFLFLTQIEFKNQ